MKIVLVGASLRSGNRGVNALTRGTINALIDKYGESNINIDIIAYGMSDIVHHNVRYKDYCLEVRELTCTRKKSAKLFLNSLLPKVIGFKGLKNSLIKNCREVYNTVNDADLILDISEGDSFSDIYGYSRFMLHSFLKLAVIKYKKKLILLPQTMGPFNNDIVKKVAKYILQNSHVNFVRDMISYNIVFEELRVPKNKVIYSPDMAFYMEPDFKYNLSNFVEYDSKEDSVIGINVSALLLSGGYSQNNMFNFKSDYKSMIDQIIRYFMELENTKVVFIPHVIIPDMPVEDDFEVCKGLYNQYKNQYKNRIYYVDKKLNEAELKGVISDCSFFVGSRMHSCIGAVSCSVPTVPVAYSRKFIGIWEELGLARCVADPRNQEIKEILDVIKASYSGKEAIRSELKEKISSLKLSIIEMFNYI